MIDAALSSALAGHSSRVCRAHPIAAGNAVTNTSGYTGKRRRSRLVVPLKNQAEKKIPVMIRARNISRCPSDVCSIPITAAKRSVPTLHNPGGGDRRAIFEVA